MIVHALLAGMLLNPLGDGVPPTAGQPSADERTAANASAAPASDVQLAPDPVQLNLEPPAAQQAPGSESAADAQPSESLPILTLAQAMDEAQKNNTTLEKARTQLSQAELYSRKAWASYLPQITLAASLTHNSDPTATVNQQPIMATDAITQQMGGPYLISVASSDYSMEVGKNVFGAQVSFQQALIVPQLWAAIRNTYIAERVVNLTVENARREVLFGVSQLYISAATLKETIAVRKRMLANTEAHEKDARFRFEAGTIPKIQLIRAQIDTVNAQQQVLQAENNYMTAKLALATLIGRNVVDFDVETPEEVQPPEGNEEELIQRAAESRPDVVSARDSLKMAELGMKQALYAYLPSLFFVASYQWGRPSYWLSDSMEALMDASGQSLREEDKWTQKWSVGLAFSWTIWDGGAREVAVKENDAKIAAAEADLRGAESKVREEVKSAIVSLNSARSNIINAKEQLRLARENSDMVNVNFNAGVATQLDVSDANTSLIGAELNLIAQTMQAQISALTLLKAAGLFEPPAPGSSEKGTESSGGSGSVKAGTDDQKGGEAKGNEAGAEQPEQTQAAPPAPANAPETVPPPAEASPAAETAPAAPANEPASAP